MDQNETRNNGAQVDNIYSNEQMLVCEKKKRFHYVDLWAAEAKATAHLDFTTPHHTEIGDMLWVILFRHLFALGLPDVSCLASADFFQGQESLHLSALPAQC